MNSEERTVEGHVTKFDGRMISVRFYMVRKPVFPGTGPIIRSIVGYFSMN